MVQDGPGEAKRVPPTPLFGSGESERDSPQWVIKEIDTEGDPFLGWYVVLVPVRGKDMNLVYGPYNKLHDAEKVGMRVRKALDSE